MGLIVVSIVGVVSSLSPEVSPLVVLATWTVAGLAIHGALMLCAIVGAMAVTARLPPSGEP